MRKSCSIKNCTGAAIARGYCSKHYNRFQRHGDALANCKSYQPRGTALKFLADSMLANTDVCIAWPFHINKVNGYGQVEFRGKTTTAHRAMAFLCYGEPTSNAMEVAHSCGVRCCINPRHLRWDTRSANHRDKHLHGTIPLGSKHPLARLTDDGVRYIWMNKGKLTHAEMAEKLNVSRPTVSLVIEGRTWAHLTEELSTELAA